MSESEQQVWRIVDATGAVREASVRAGHSVMSGVGYFACLSANDAGAFGASERVAVLRLAAEYRVAVAEILAPGEPTRAEAVAAARREGAEAMRAEGVAACGRVRAESDNKALGRDRDAACFGARRCRDAIRALPLPGDEVTP